MSKKNTSDRYCSIDESLKQSLKEVELIREGKLPKENLNDIFERIKESFEQIKKVEDGKRSFKTLEESRALWKQWADEVEDDLNA